MADETRISNHDVRSVSVDRMVHRTKRKYSSPARYSSTTFVRVWPGPNPSYQIISSNHGGFGNVIKKLRIKYPNAEFKIDKSLVYYNSSETS